MQQQAQGSFAVKLQAQAPADNVASAQIGRQTIDKQFEGDLQATSLGEMLAVMSGVKGSAGYVALERVQGSLHGKRGSLVLQHNAVMNRGVPSLNVEVVPDSGTDELTGLSGTMRIEITQGQHYYVFDYSLAE